MKTFIYSISLIALTFLSLLAQSQHVLKWRTGERLTWNDFQALPQHDAWQSAVTSTSFSLKPVVVGDHVKVYVFSYFDKSKSWVKPGHKQYNLLLHEQGHFDLRELYTRKLKKALTKLKANRKNINRKLNRLFKKNAKAFQKANKKYDKQTNYSRKKDDQRQWAQYIIDELIEYKSYTQEYILIEL